MFLALTLTYSFSEKRCVLVGLRLGAGVALKLARLFDNFREGEFASVLSFLSLHMSSRSNNET